MLECSDGSARIHVSRPVDDHRNWTWEIDHELARHWQKFFDWLEKREQSVTDEEPPPPMDGG